MKYYEYYTQLVSAWGIWHLSSIKFILNMINQISLHEKLLRISFSQIQLMN